MGTETVKLFISYCWSSPEHEAWVLRFATQLRESGVDVILDKWDLKEGHDAVAFMEKMVADPSVTRVIMVCDKNYVKKTDGREGGVGTEAQIISAKIYQEGAQDKFVAVVAEKDEDGKPFLPTYYSSRIYIDLSDEDDYSTNFEQVLRWVYGKPVYQRPALGKKPEFLDDEKAISLGTSARFRRAIDAVKGNKDFAAGALSEYLNTIVENLESFRISKKLGVELDDQIVANIEQFVPYRNELIEIFSVLAQYRDNEDSWQILHRFIERLLPFTDRPEHVMQWTDWEFDNFKFLIGEIFLYLISVLLRHERFSAAAYFMDQRYLIRFTSGTARKMLGFEAFRFVLNSLDHRNRRLNARRISLHADLLEQRSKSSGQTFESLMQADFTLYTKDALRSLRGTETQTWWPITLVYSGRLHTSFEIYLRAESKRYFENIKTLFGVSSEKELEQIALAFQQRKLREMSFDYSFLNWRQLSNLDNLAKQP